eukprot:3546999-Amphidinium_carterae.1
MLTARITWSPLSGSTPSKLFAAISKPVSALIVRMPLSGIGAVIHTQAEPALYKPMYNSQGIQLYKRSQRPELLDMRTPQESQVAS